MNYAQKKYDGIKKYFKKVLSFGTSKSVGEYQDLVTQVKVHGQTKKIWTKAFQTALNENEHVYLPSGEYYLDGTVVIPSHRKISADKNAVVLLLNGTKVVMFRNEHVLDGTASLITLDERHSENIEIDGGTWGTEYTCRADYGKIGAYDDEDGLHGVHALMLFSGVRNLRIRNVTYQQAATFALQIGRAENFLIENVQCVNCFADGVHLNGVVRNGVLYDISGHTEDDLVALNAYDWDNSTINNGFMEDITVTGVHSSGGHCHCMRIQPGVTAKEKGNIDFRLNLKDYPDTAHFITVGPKSRYLAEGTLEIFDPYVSCFVQELIYDDITVNGEAVVNMDEHIKEIAFERLYPSEYSSGMGQINQIKKLER